MPVLANVAAILFPIWPDLPTPDTITRPVKFSMSFTRSLKSLGKSSLSFPRASASVFKTFFAAVTKEFAMIHCPINRDLARAYRIKRINFKGSNFIKISSHKCNFNLKPTLVDCFSDNKSNNLTTFFS